MYQDTVYKGLFQTQLLFAIPATPCFLSFLITAYLVSATTDFRWLALFAALWLFFYATHRTDRHIVDVYLASLSLYLSQRPDKIIHARIHD